MSLSRYPEIILQVSDEQGYQREGDAFPGAEHPFAAHGIERIGVHDDQAAVALGAYFAAVEGALAEHFP